MINIANFMDSSLCELNKKGNLNHAIKLYNLDPRKIKVTHFTPYIEDLVFCEEFKKHNIEIFCYLKDRKQPKVLVFAKSLLCVFKKIWSGNIQIIRGRLPYFGSLLGCIVGFLLRKPIIVSLGGNNRLAQERENLYYLGGKKTSFFVEKLVLTMSNYLIAPNNYTKNYISSIIGDKKTDKKTRIIPWILPDSEKISITPTKSPRKFLNLQKNFTICIIGFINRYKYSNVIFEVAENVLSKENNINFVFCGDGPLRPVGEEKLKKFKSVYFLGWQDNKNAQKILKSSDLVLIPMSGFVLLEAGCLAKPVITSNLEWHSEFVEHMESGIVVNPENIDEWVDGILFMAKNPQKASMMGENLRNKFISDYNPQKLAEKEILLYEEALRRKK